MEATAGVLAIFLLVCASALAVAAVLVCWAVACDEIARLLRRRRERRELDLRLERMIHPAGKELE